MAPPRRWTVLPHGKVANLGDNLRAVEGTLPRGHVPRRMVVARRADGRLLFYNAIPLAEEAMASLEAFGAPAFLVVPNQFHRLDVHAFKERYPGLQVLCPRPIREKVARAVEVNGDLSDFPADPELELQIARGTNNSEAILVIKAGAETSIVFADVLMNLTRVPGLDGLLFTLIGSVGGPRVTRLARLLTVNDRTALCVQLQELAALPNLARLIPTHGDIVDQSAASVLCGVAANLGR
jgi:hypothetical protein